MVSKTKSDAHVESRKKPVQTTKRNLQSPAIELPELATDRSHNFAVRRERNSVVLKESRSAECDTHSERYEYVVDFHENNRIR